MKNGSVIRRVVFALAALALPAGIAHAQVVAPQPNWGCWVSDPAGRFQVHFLRCVAMNEAVAVTQERRIQPDWQLLEFVRVLIAAGRVERIERLLASPDTQLPYGALWQSRIDTYPLDEEWAVGWPEQLARATLCADPAACAVFVQRQ